MKPTIFRVKINKGGYDNRGRYWGIGEPLYRYEWPDGRFGHVRAKNFYEAKKKVMSDEKKYSGRLNW